MTIKLLARISLFIMFSSTLQLALAQENNTVLEIQHWTTSNGMRAYFVENHELAMIDIHIAFAAGSARDDNKPGLAALTSTMLRQGSGNLNADQMAE
ncbi:MAG: insulinase family protein, partial [Gammaproteobacteria bacterium]